MRGRLLAAVLLALGCVSVGAVAIPIAQGSPVVIGFTGTTATNVANAPTPGFRATPAPAATTNAPVHGVAVHVDVRALVQQPPTEQPDQPTSQATDQPVAPTATPVPLDPTDKPTEQPTDRPTDQPQPTATPRPDPTASARPTGTPQPTPRPTVRPADSPTPSPTPTRTPDPTPKPTATPTPEPTPPPTTYSGTSHFWYPALNIDASWDWYGCDYGGDPVMPAGIWRWGCGPSSNIYLLSHAWSTFKKLRAGYHSGALQVGQTVWYANASGDVSEWQVKWIHRVTADYLNATAGDWADNDSPTPIMTLQTCDGPQSQLRIIVRLVPAN